MKRILISFQISLVLFILLGASGKVSAQRVNSLYFLDKTPFHTQWNPAMAPKRSGLGIGLSSFSISVQSDLAFDDLFIPSEDGSKLNTFLHPSVDKNIFVDGLKSVSNMNFNSTLDYFNLGIRIKNNYFTIHSGITMDGGIGLPKDLFRMFLLGMNTNQNSTPFNLTEMNANAMAYSKIGIGYSMIIGKKLTIGFNANYLHGIADMRMGFDKLTIDASQTNWNVTSKGYIQMAGPECLNFGYNDQGYLNSINYDSKRLGGLTSIISSMPKTGNGFSMDLGATLKPLNFLTLSAAITDLGSIKWNKNSIQRASANGVFAYEGIALNKEAEKTMDGSDVINSVEDMVHFEKDNAVKSYSSNLTTKLNIGAEAGAFENRISIGVLSQTGFATNGTYQDVMFSANLKPSSILQTALTYSVLHGEQSSFGAAVNLKLVFVNLFIAADYIPTQYTPQYIPVSNSYLNMQFGLNMMF